MANSTPSLGSSPAVVLASGPAAMAHWSPPPPPPSPPVFLPAGPQAPKKLESKEWSVWSVRSMIFAIAAIVALGVVMGYHYGSNGLFETLSLKQGLILGGLGLATLAVTSYVLYNIHHYNVKTHQKAPAAITDKTALQSRGWWERRSWEEKTLITLIAIIVPAYFLTAGVLAGTHSPTTALNFLATPWTWIGSTFQPGSAAIFITAYSVALPTIVYLGLTAYWHRNDNLIERSERDFLANARSAFPTPPPQTPPAPPRRSGVLTPPPLQFVGDPANRVLAAVPGSGATVMIGPGGYTLAGAPLPLGPPGPPAEEPNTATPPRAPSPTLRYGVPDDTGWSPPPPPPVDPLSYQHVAYIRSQTQARGHSLTPTAHDSKHSDQMQTNDAP